MRKYEIKEVTTKQNVLNSVSCNGCGKEFKDEYGINHWTDKNDLEVHSFTTSFGYYSSFDEETWSFDLCQDCLVGLVKSFKYVPTGFQIDNHNRNSLSDEAHQAAFDRWKETGEWNEYILHTYEELIEIRDGFNKEYFSSLIKKCHPDKYDDYVEKYLNA